MCMSFSPIFNSKDQPVFTSFADEFFMELLCQVFLPARTNPLPSPSRSSQHPRALPFSTWKGIDEPRTSGSAASGQREGMWGSEVQEGPVCSEQSFELVSRDKLQPASATLTFPRAKLHLESVL